MWLNSIFITRQSRNKNMQFIILTIDSTIFMQACSMIFINMYIETYKSVFGHNCFESTIFSKLH